MSEPRYIIGVNEYRVCVASLIHAVLKYDFITYCGVFNFELSSIVKPLDVDVGPVDCMTCLVKSYE